MKSEHRGGAATPKTPYKNCKYIISDKVLNYTDALYLYANAEDLYEGEYGDIVEAYNEVCKTIVFRKYPDSEQVGYANNRRWFDTPNFRIGIMDYETARKLNQYTLEIQYKHHHIFRLNNDISNLELPYGSDLSKYKIKRVDVTKTLKLNTNYTKDHGFITKFRDDGLNPRRVGDGALTVYFGTRGACMLRIYSKTDELRAKKDYPKIERYRAIFGDIENLYTFEYEFHRKYLIKNYGIDSLEDFDKVLQLGSMKFGEIGIFEINDKNIKNYKNRHHDRILQYRFKDNAFIKRKEQKKYAPSFTYMIRRLRKEVNRYIMTSESKPSKSEILLSLFPEELELRRASDINYQEFQELAAEQNMYLIKL